MCFKCKDTQWILEDKPRWISPPNPGDPVSKGKWSEDKYTYARRCECHGGVNKGVRSHVAYTAPEDPPEPVSEKPKPMKEKYVGVDPRAQLPDDFR